MSDVQRNPEGQFRPGQSGNPSGRPKADQTIRYLARAHTGPAVRTLVEVMEDPKAHKSARIQAAIALLDRGWGKPPQYSESDVRIRALEHPIPSASNVDLEERIKMLVFSDRLEEALK